MPWLVVGLIGWLSARGLSDHLRQPLTSVNRGATNGDWQVLVILLVCSVLLWWPSLLMQCGTCGKRHTRLGYSWSGRGAGYSGSPCPARGAGCARWKAASVSTQAATSGGTGERPLVQRRIVVCGHSVRRANSRSGQPITARQTSKRCGDMGAAVALGSAPASLFSMREAGPVCSI